MKRFIPCSLLILAFVLSGCATTRVIPYEVERVDQEITGNRGIVRGKVPPVTETGRKKTRTMYNIEIELSSKQDKDVSKKDTTYTEGNRGYLLRKGVPEKKTTTLKKQKEAMTLKGFGASQAPQVVYQRPIAPAKKYKKEKGSGAIVEKEKGEQEIYVVQKGDTLQKISDKVYGTTKKWKKIYEANEDTLKSPDLIRPGQKLVIPE